MEASSDSDDEDKLHIVEEDSLQGPEVADGGTTTPEDSHDAATAVLPNGSWNGGETPGQKTLLLKKKKKKKHNTNQFNL